MYPPDPDPRPQHCLLDCTFFLVSIVHWHSHCLSILISRFFLHLLSGWEGEGEGGGEGGGVAPGLILSGEPEIYRLEPSGVS
jgi:hypothetical protein